MRYFGSIDAIRSVSPHLNERYQDADRTVFFANSRSDRENGNRRSCRRAAPGDDGEEKSGHAAEAKKLWRETLAEYVAVREHRDGAVVAEIEKRLANAKGGEK